MEENKQYTVFKFQRLFRSKWNQVSKLPLHHSLCTVCDICKSNLLRQKGSGSDRVICIYIFTWCQLMMKPAFSKWRQLRAALKKFQTGALCSAVPGKLVNDTPASVQIPFRNYTGSHLGCLTILFICLCCWLKDPMPLLDIATTWFHVVQCQVSEALGSFPSINSSLFKWRPWRFSGFNLIINTIDFKTGRYYMLLNENS